MPRFPGNDGLFIDLLLIRDERYLLACKSEGVYLRAISSVQEDLLLQLTARRR